MFICMYVCMHVCTKSFLKTTTNSSCVCTHLANKADSDSDSDSDSEQDEHCQSPTKWSPAGHWCEWLWPNNQKQTPWGWLEGPTSSSGSCARCPASTAVWTLRIVQVCVTNPRLFLSKPAGVARIKCSCWLFFSIWVLRISLVTSHLWL